MNVPQFVYDKVLDDSNHLTANWNLWYSQLIAQLNENFGPQGLVMPSLDQASIDLLTQATNGTMIYNTTTNKAMVNVNGTFVNFP